MGADVVADEPEDTGRPDTDDATGAAEAEVGAAHGDGAAGAPDEPLAWAIEAARAAATKTDEDTTLLEVGPVLGIVGYFVITAGRNGRQVRAIAEEIEKLVAQAGGPKPVRIEGLDALEWVLMDYGDFVVHVFHSETRRFYDLERLWRDVPRVGWRPDPA